MLMIKKAIIQSNTHNNNNTTHQSSNSNNNQIMIKQQQQKKYNLNIVIPNNLNNNNNNNLSNNDSILNSSNRGNSVLESLPDLLILHIIRYIGEDIDLIGLLLFTSKRFFKFTHPSFSNRIRFKQLQYFNHDFMNPPPAPRSPTSSPRGNSNYRTKFNTTPSPPLSPVGAPQPPAWATLTPLAALLPSYPSSNSSTPSSSSSSSPSSSPISSPQSANTLTIPTITTTTTPSTTSTIFYLSTLKSMYQSSINQLYLRFCDNNNNSFGNGLMNSPRSSQSPRNQSPRPNYSHINNNSNNNQPNHLNNLNEEIKDLIIHFTNSTPIRTIPTTLRHYQNCTSICLISTLRQNSIMIYPEILPCSLTSLSVEGDCKFIVDSNLAPNFGLPPTLKSISVTLPQTILSLKPLPKQLESLQVVDSKNQNQNGAIHLVNLHGQPNQQQQDQGFAILSDLQLYNTNLKHLNLAGVMINLSGVQSLLPPTLTHLEFHTNQSIDAHLLPLSLNTLCITSFSESGPISSSLSHLENLVNLSIRINYSSCYLNSQLPLNLKSLKLICQNTITFPSLLDNDTNQAHQPQSLPQPQSPSPPTTSSTPNIPTLILPLSLMSVESKLFTIPKSLEKLKVRGNLNRFEKGCFPQGLLKLKLKSLSNFRMGHGDIPESVKDLTLYHCRLTDDRCIPSRVEKLYLTCCKFDAKCRLPDSISQLSIYNQQFEMAPNGIEFPPTLSKLNLQVMNKGFTFPRGLGKSLETLFIGPNLVDILDSNQIPSSIPPPLEHLSFKITTLRDPGMIHSGVLEDGVIQFIGNTFKWIDIEKLTSIHLHSDRYMYGNINIIRLDDIILQSNIQLLTINFAGGLTYKFDIKRLYNRHNNNNSNNDNNSSKGGKSKLYALVLERSSLCGGVVKVCEKSSGSGSGSGGRLYLQKVDDRYTIKSIVINSMKDKVKRYLPF